MWLENLRELKKTSGKSSKLISEGTLLPERTIVRIFSGETNNPSISTLIPIVNFLGGSLDEVFADTKAVVGEENLATLKEVVDVVSAEKNLVVAETKVLQDKVAALTAENELLKLKLLHKEEIIALHNYYNKLNPNKKGDDL